MMMVGFFFFRLSFVKMVLSAILISLKEGTIGKRLYNKVVSVCAVAAAAVITIRIEKMIFFTRKIFIKLNCLGENEMLRQRSFQFRVFGLALKEITPQNPQPLKL